MGVELAADVEDSPAFYHSAHSLRPCFIFDGTRHQQCAEGSFVLRSAPATWLPPFAISVPHHETDQPIVNLVYEAIHPIHPKRLEAIDSRSADQRSSPVQVGRQTLDNRFSRGLVYVPVDIEGQTRVDPIAVGLVAQTPEPLADRFRSPAIDRPAHQSAGATGEPANRRSIGVWPPELRESHHRHSPGRQDPGDVSLKTLPALSLGAVIIHRQPYDLRRSLAYAGGDIAGGSTLAPEVVFR